jgi:hypothetical protein
MKSSRPLSSSGNNKAHAAEALKSVLQQVSAFRIKEIDLDFKLLGKRIDFLAQVDVFGHPYNLACKVMEGDKLPQEHELLECREHLSQIPNSTLVLIGPHLTDEARSLCCKHQAGFVDLSGNARIEIGEVFIARQHLPLTGESSARKPASSSAHPFDRPLLRKLPQARADILSPDRAIAVANA